MQIDELVVKLTADAEGLIAGQKKTEEMLESLSKKSEAVNKKQVKAANDVDAALKKQNKEEAKAEKERERQAKKQADALLTLKKEIIAVTAAYLGFTTLKSIGENLLKMNAQIGFSADTLGLSEEGLNSWIQTASQFNAGADEVTSAFGKINQMQASFKTGVGTETSIAALTQYAQALQALPGGGKVDMAQLTGRNTTSEDFLKELAFETQHMSLKNATIALSALGISPNMARMLHDEDIISKLATAKQTDPEAEKAIQNARDLAQQWARVKTQAKGVADTIENDIMPSLQKLTDAIAGALSFAKEHPKTTETVVGAGTAAVAGGSAYIGYKWLQGILGKAGVGAAESVATGAGRAGLGALMHSEIGLAILTIASLAAALSQLPPGPKAGHTALLDPSTRRLMQGSLTNQSSSEVNIGQLTVTTQATDAPGVAKAVSHELQHWSHATNANSGVR